MIRLSSSFLISLAIHALIALSLFYTYKTIVAFKSDKNKKVELKLCRVVEKKEIDKPLEQPKKQPKILPEKPKPIKPKPIVKTVPVVMQKIEKEEPLEDTQEIEVSKKEIITTHKKNISQQELNPEVIYLDKNIKLIQQLIQENLYYPRSARKRVITGEVGIEFTLSPNASVNNIKVYSSPHNILSSAAVKTIESLSGKFPKPKQELTLKVPITYSLSQ